MNLLLSPKALKMKIINLDAEGKPIDSALLKRKTKRGAKHATGRHYIPDPEGVTTPSVYRSQHRSKGITKKIKARKKAEAERRKKRRNKSG